MTWWTDYQARRGQDRKTLFTDNMKNLVSTEFENSTSYELVKISDVDRKTRIVEESSIIKNPNRKRLLCFPDETINIGEIVEFDDSNWICVNNDTTSQISDVGIIEKCNNTLQFYDSSSTLHQIPCIISKGSISLDEQKIISTLDSEIAIQISNTSITRQIPMNYVFKIGMRNYSVVNIDDITVNGLLLIKMVYSEVEQVFPSYSLTILNGDSIQVNENDSLIINAQVKIDGIIVSTVPNLVFSSNDITKATINSITGVVTILDVGNVVFSCRMANDLNVMDEISVEIVSVPQNNYTVEISGSTSIIKTYTKEYLAVFKNNGLPIIKESSFWLTGIDNLPTTLAIITSQNAINNTCVVRGDYLGYVKIWCKSVDEEIVSQDGMVIQVKSLF